MYVVREIFRTLQGEGALAGTPMVFVRFAGCNLWSGREEHRRRDAERFAATCPRFCDTDFLGGDGLSEQAILARVRACSGPGWVCYTGGEPLLQLDRDLLEATHAAGYKVALETNGTVALDRVAGLVDWLCVSPKTADFELRSGNELKVVYSGQPAEALLALGALDFEVCSLQPEWGPDYARHLEAALAFLQGQSRWRLSLQTHKLVGLP